MTSPLIIAADEVRSKLHWRKVDLIGELTKRGIPALEGAIPVDYAWVANGVPIMGDNKTPADLIASAQDGRLHEQTRAMKEANAFGFILIEGAWGDGYTVERWTYDQFADLVMSVQLEGIKIDLSPEASATPRRLASLYRWTHKEQHGSWHTPVPLLPAGYDYGDEDYRWQVGMIMHLGGKGGGCGPDKAEKLIRAFGLRGTLGITEDDETLKKRWMTIRGVGKTLTDKWIRWVGA
jgi:ERCC4-type nuclease